MSEPEDTLSKALAENAQFRAEKAEVLKKESSAQFREGLKWSERIMWLYLLGCVAVGVPVVQLFMESSADTNTLIRCTAGLLVVFGMTVQLKLWRVVVATKLILLKDISQLRLEVGQLASAAGVAPHAELFSTKYEPMRGASPWERKAWIGAAAAVAVLASSVASGQFGWLFDRGGVLSADALVTIADDGSATSVVKMSRTRRERTAATNFPFHAPASWSVRWVDSRGREMPYDTTRSGNRVDYVVRVPDDLAPDERRVYTRMVEIPEAATQSGGVWTYASDISYGFGRNEFTTTVLLPKGAEFVSSAPESFLEFTIDGRPAIRFQATRGTNEKFAYNVQYRLPAE